MEITRFMQNISEGLIQNQFKIVSTEEKTPLTYVRFEHSHLYIINLIPANIELLEQWEEREQLYEQRLRKNPDNIQADRIIAINIYVAKEQGQTIYQHIAQKEFYPDDEVYIIPWIVDLEQKKLLIPHSYPDSILGIEKMISRILQEEEGDATEGFDLERIKQAAARTQLTTRSRDIFFTFGLIGINLLVWLMMEREGGSTNGEILLRFGANQPILVLQEKQYWRLFTSMFLHIGLMHLLYNGFALYLFGSRVEKYYGKLPFTIIYILSGLTGSIATILISSATLSAGASGAIYGLLGATFALGQITKKQVDQLSSYTMAIMILIGIAMGFTDPKIGNAAHIGGLIMGYIIGYLICKYHIFKEK